MRTGRVREPGSDERILRDNPSSDITEGEDSIMYGGIVVCISYFVRLSFSHRVLGLKGSAHGLASD